MLTDVQTRRNEKYAVDSSFDLLIILQCSYCSRLIIREYVAYTNMWQCSKRNKSSATTYHGHGHFAGEILSCTHYSCRHLTLLPMRKNFSPLQHTIIYYSRHTCDIVAGEKQMLLYTPNTDKVAVQTISCYNALRACGIVVRETFSFSTDCKRVEYIVPCTC